MCETMASAMTSGVAGTYAGSAESIIGSAHLPSTVACERSSRFLPHTTT